MDNQLKYKISYISPDDNRLRNSIMKHNTSSLLFTDVIEINPHNIVIAYVSCYFPRIDKYIAIYDRYSNLFCSISSIKSSLNYSILSYGLIKEEQNEIYHLIDLWLTKFVDN